MSTIAPPRPRSRQRDSAKTRRNGPLGTYTDEASTARELVCVAGAAGTRLVIDQPVGGIRSRRVLAHLAADEPAENAAHVARAYLAAPRVCRSLTPADLHLAFGEGASSTDDSNGRASLAETSLPRELVDRHGALYRLAPVRTQPGIAQLRWTRRQADGEARQVLSVRAVVGALESYEPVLGLTRAAVAHGKHDDTVSVAVLDAEYERTTTSVIVLNRGLREEVADSIARGEVTASEIAIRCGRVRRGPRGAVSGETSWLMRRIGQVAEAGHSEPTPWIHSDVLALIAREGLSVNPNEVEL
jgi:hypothetical protein